MAPRTRDGTTEATLDSTPPKDRRIPLHCVVFAHPVPVPGAGDMVTNVTVGETRLRGGQPWACPQPFLDPQTRSVVIEGREYPLERVVYWERAKMARNVKPAQPDPGITIKTSKVVGKPSTS